MHKDDSPVVRKRAHAIILLFGDHRTFEDVAKIFDVHVNTPRNWAERWVYHGTDGLYDQPGRGAKPIFEPWEEKIILGYVEEEPRSLRSVAQKVEKYLGKKVSIETLRSIVKKYGKIWKRERKKVKKQPPAEKLDEWEKLGLTLYFLPTYSLQLNLIEILWRKIKYEWMPISAYTDFKSLESRLRDI